MRYEELREPKEIEIDGRKFVISKIPATKAMPIYDSVEDTVSKKGVIGITSLPDSTQREILKYVNAYFNNAMVSLELESDINQVFTDFGTLAKVMIEMVSYNFSFFVRGDLLEALQRAAGATEYAS